MDKEQPLHIGGLDKPRHIIRLKARSSESKKLATQNCSAGAPAMQPPPTNQEPVQCHLQNTVVLTKENNMAGQTTDTPRHDSGSIKSDVSATKTGIRKHVSDVNNDDTKEGGAIVAEMNRLFEEYNSLQDRKGNSPFWEPSDEVRLLEVERRFDRLNNHKPSTTEDDNAANRTSKSVIDSSIDDLSQSVKAETAQVGKRKAVEESTTGSSTAAPAQKKRRMTKGTRILVKSATDYISKSNMGQHQGTVKIKLNSNALKNFGSRRKAPRHAKDHLSKIEAVALRRPHVDETTVKAEVAALSAMVRVFEKRAQPWGDPLVDDDKKTVEHYKWSVEGMGQPLYHHQLIAAGMMTYMEQGDLGSGLLFDHMGYGKTVETLALILRNPPNSRAKGMDGHQITLIVCPKSAARQWVKEVNDHCTKLYALQWGSNLEQQIPNFHLVVVTSYSQLAAAHKTVNNKKKKSKLFDLEFHRVVLDEIHEIRSPTLDTARFKACHALKAKHYWGLTGTPTPNSVLELFPYLKFIRHPGVTSLKDFKDAIVGGKGHKEISKETRNHNLNKLLGPCMIYRTPTHQFLGTTLVDLPNAHPTYQKVELSEEESVIYEFIDKHIKQYIRRKPRNPKKSSKKVRRSSWAMLNESALRFRQCVASPLLLERIVKDGIWTGKQLEAMKAEALSRGCKETPFIDLFQCWIREPKNMSYPKPQATLEYLENACQAVDKYTCPGCGTYVQKHPQKGACDHIWCQVCVEEHMKSSIAKDPNEEPTCLRCKTLLGEIKLSVNPRLQAGDSSSEPPSSNEAKVKKPRKPGDDYNGIQPKSESQSKYLHHIKPTLFTYLDSKPETPIPLSAKMRGMVEQISAWQHEDPSDKIIGNHQVFTQFIDVNRLMGRALQQLGIEFLYYTGEMDEVEREVAKSSFAEESVIKVMFVSLRCGGQALNLTCANRVIIADPWWNHCAEEQAISRVYRIGQKKEVYSVRFLAHDTVDDHMHQLQVSKLNETRDMLDEFQADRGKSKREALAISMNWSDELGDGGNEESESEAESEDESEAEGVVTSEDEKDGDCRP